ncbi:MAG: cytidine deaminase [Flavobacteriales bacterium]|nr:cytidine deaminase [Flavobacteriales bacterium]
MKQIKNSILNHTKNLSPFTELEKSLILEAEKATANAYAPFSNFFVGAAILLQNGEIITGSNQENASYPNGLCAERVALNTYGNMRTEEKIVAMAITAKSKDFKIPEILSPCGACLQVMAEYVKRQNSDFRIIVFSEVGGYYYAEGVSTFLPFGFNLNRK